MNATFRASLLALGLFAGGMLAAPVISAAGENPSSAATGSLAEAAPPSVFVPIVAYRALDTRDSNKLDVDGEPFSADSPLVRFFADLENDGDGFAKIPAEAVAVSFNITVAQTEGIGFLTVSPANVSSGTTSNINWTTDGQQAANSGNVLLGANNDGGNGSDSLDVTIGGAPGAKTHVLIDITGYYLPANT